MLVFWYFGVLFYLQTFLRPLIFDTLFRAEVKQVCNFFSHQMMPLQRQRTSVFQLGDSGAPRQLNPSKRSEPGDSYPLLPAWRPRRGRDIELPAERSESGHMEDFHSLVVVDSSVRGWTQGMSL